jgi:hypothetical protein
MSGWKSVRNLFWVSNGASGKVPEAGGEELSDEEFEALLSSSEHAVPPGVSEPVPSEALKLGAQEGVVALDFQAQYDLAGIPNTDEVEQLEGFLSRLDGSLPQASKLAAAEAFLGAIGKDRSAVLLDAERKIKRVRGILSAMEAEAQQALAREQAEIDELNRRIEQHRHQMEGINRHIEGVRHACHVEEARLQGARVFFGNVAKA